jgi:hypothetical protein
VDEPEREKPRRGTGWAIPAVLVVVVAALLVGTSRRESEPEPTPMPPTVPTATSFLFCTDCHGDLDDVFKSGERPNLLFTHEEHFGIGVSDCGACHVANTHERDQINSPEMVTCYACHGLEEDARAPGDCTLCHPPGMAPEPESHLVVDWTVSAHTTEAETDPFDCTTCHRQNFCDSCHGLEMPHPTGFDARPHAEGFYEDPALCETCHVRGQEQGRDECDPCHHPEGPKDTTWIDYHEKAVRGLGADTCFQCHANETCRTCHKQGTENFTNEDFEADEALLISQGNPGD